GARPPEERRNREVEAVQRQIWTQAVTVVFETDAAAIAAVLPPPLEPSADASTARLRIATVDMGTGLKPFGAGWFGVRCQHGSTEGEYALFMPMTTEQATIGGRETFGEPKKIADVTLQLDSDSVQAWIERLGFRVAEVSGQLGEEGPGYEKDKIDFYFKLSPNPDGVGLDGDPPFVYCHRHESARAVRRIDGELKLMESPLDPVADFPVERIVSMEYAEIAGTQRGEIVGHVPATSLLPYVHQRYDDLSVLGAKS
ncbi:MAG: acetoacetate decarboxylase family protein, partial [Acidimicrobiia bacterium]|nr:acetoacetate decarboxylase family protein [Acidimicrobiia bacterium]